MCDGTLERETSLSKTFALNRRDTKRPWCKGKCEENSSENEGECSRRRRTEL